MASAAQAGDDKTPAAATDGKAAPVKEKKICHTERVTGSLTQSNRICMTQAEWDALELQTKKDLDNISRNVKVSNSGPFGG